MRNEKYPNYTPQDLQTAYQIVQNDLFNSFLQAQPGQTIKLGRLGKFTKCEQIVRNKQYGNHIYYKLSFRCFGKLKDAFHEQLSQKYGK